VKKRYEDHDYRPRTINNGTHDIKILNACGNSNRMIYIVYKNSSTYKLLRRRRKYYFKLLSAKTSCTILLTLQRTDTDLFIGYTSSSTYYGFAYYIYYSRQSRKCRYFPIQQPEQAPLDMNSDSDYEHALWPRHLRYEHLLQCDHTLSICLLSSRITVWFARLAFIFTFVQEPDYYSKTTTALQQWWLELAMILPLLYSFRDLLWVSRPCDFLVL
jgi:hypothetical protein